MKLFKNIDLTSKKLNIKKKKKKNQQHFEAVNLL